MGTLTDFWVEQSAPMELDEADVISYKWNYYMGASAVISEIVSALESGNADLFSQRMISLSTEIADETLNLQIDMAAYLNSKVAH